MRALQLEFELYQIDIDKITEWYTRKIRELFVDALSEALVVAETFVPVLTGRAKGAYLKIVRSLRLNVSLDFTVTSPYWQKLDYYDYDQETGAAETYVNLYESTDVYTFDFNTGVPYFGRWDIPRWQSLDYISVSVERYFEYYAEDYLPVFDDEDNFILTRIES
jgi:hypothetical protein